MGAETWRSHLRTTWDRAVDRCSQLFPSLYDPARRSALSFKVALVVMHLVFAGVIFLFDHDLIVKIQREPWYTALYATLFVATLVQYFVTSGTSPGYVLDIQKVVDEKEALAKRALVASKLYWLVIMFKQRQPASSKNGSIAINVNSRTYGSGNGSAWTELVMDLYPPGASIRNLTCTYCNVIQPPRAKHCQDCDKCVLEFDHHCVWLGTCIGQGNHCQFWWYISEESALCLWTSILYIGYLSSNVSKAWWEASIIMLLLVALSISLLFLLLLLLFHSYLILTNQTTYELVRRRRIMYLSFNIFKFNRGVPERVHPFSKGVCQNLYLFCCCSNNGSKYRLERIPTAAELEEKFRPFTCIDLMLCRCC